MAIRIIRRPIDFRRICEQVSARQVLDRIGWVPQWRSAEKARGPCPLHGSSSPRSRSLATDGPGWYCHKCRRCGDSVALYAALGGLDMYGAALELCAEFGLDVPYLAR